MANPATKKRGGNPDVKHKPEDQKPKDALERKLEQGLSNPWRVPIPSVSLNRQKPNITKRERTPEGGGVYWGRPKKKGHSVLGITHTTVYRQKRTPALGPRF